MAEYSRPATLEDLKTLVRALNEQGTDYLLIGGYALLAHGFQRATVDIDLLVPANRASGEQVRRALLVLPDQAAREMDPSWFEEGDTIRVADEFVIDVMFRACGETYESLLPFEVRVGPGRNRAGAAQSARRRHLMPGVKACAYAKVSLAAPRPSW